MWVSAEDVAKAAVTGMERGRSVVIPGTPNRVLARLSYLSPRALVLPMLARQHPALKP
jgi:short-subunit dehydrogenase